MEGIALVDCMVGVGESLESPQVCAYQLSLSDSRRADILAYSFCVVATGQTSTSRRLVREDFQRHLLYASTYFPDFVNTLDCGGYEAFHVGRPRRRELNATAKRILPCQR